MHSRRHPLAATIADVTSLLSTVLVEMMSYDRRRPPRCCVRWACGRGRSERGRIDLSSTSQQPWQWWAPIPPCRRSNVRHRAKDRLWVWQYYSQSGRAMVAPAAGNAGYHVDRVCLSGLLRRLHPSHRVGKPDPNSGLAARLAAMSVKEFDAATQHAGGED